MAEPATKEDLEIVKRAVIERLDAMDSSVENMRSQNSSEHGSLFAKLTYITEMTIWLKSKWINFTRAPDPNDRH